MLGDAIISSAPEQPDKLDIATTDVATVGAVVIWYPLRSLPTWVTFQRCGA